MAALQIQKKKEKRKKRKEKKKKREKKEREKEKMREGRQGERKEKRLLFLHLFLGYVWLFASHISTCMLGIPPGSINPSENRVQWAFVAL